MPAKRNLTQPEVIARAIDLADHHGIDALSMRKLAGALGVTAMSLYNHVADKDALLDAMLDHIMAQLATPEPGDWRAMMARRARSLRQVMLAHPWAAHLAMTRIAMGPAMMDDSEACLACLIQAGFTYGQADWARNVIDSHTYGYLRQELLYPVQPEAYRAAAAQYLPMIPADLYPYSHGAARAIVDGAYDGVLSFDFGLDLVLDGIARWLAGDLALPSPPQ